MGDGGNRGRSDHDLERVVADQAHDPANERFEEAGIVHHPEEDDGEGQERCRRRDAPDAVHREAADLAGKAAGDRGHHGHERQGDDDRRDAKENQPDERGDGGDAQEGEHGSYTRPRRRPISSVCCPSAGGGSSGSTGTADSLTGFPGTRTDAAPAGISTSMFRAAS